MIKNSILVSILVQSRNNQKIYVHFRAKRLKLEHVEIDNKIEFVSVTSEEVACG